jgi:hypothetical protein
MLDVRWPPFIVRDANGQAPAYVYFEGELDRRSAAHLLTRDEAHRRQHRQAAGAVAAGSNRVVQNRPAKTATQSRRQPRIAATGASATLEESGL